MSSGNIPVNAISYLSSNIASYKASVSAIFASISYLLTLFILGPNKFISKGISIIDLLGNNSNFSKVDLVINKISR